MGQRRGRVHAGLALDAERHTRTVLATPDAATLDALAPAVQRVLDEPAFAAGARRVADAMAALPPVEHAVGVLEGLAAQAVAGA